MSQWPQDLSAEALARFAETVLDALRVPAIVLEPDLTVLSASEAFRRRLTDAEDPCGQALMSLDEGCWDQSDLHQGLERLTDEGAFFDVLVSRPGGDLWFVCGHGLAVPPGGGGLILLSFDRFPSNVRIRASQDDPGLSDAVLTTVRIPFLVLDDECRVRMANRAFLEAFELGRDEAEGRILWDLGGGAWHIPELWERLQQLLEEGGQLDDFLVEHEFGDLGRREIRLHCRPIDQLALHLLVIEDETRRRREERMQETRLSELAHRVKNLLAVVQAIASQTEAVTVTEYRSTLIGRVQALATAHGLLLETQWRKAPMKRLLRQVLTPHIPPDAGRIRVEGPPVMLPSDTITPLSLIIHELATNASKYGALSSDAGRVEVSWASQSGEVAIEWRESGGPPPPTERTAGFGTSLIAGTAAYQLGGSAELRFEPSGLQCSLRIPLEA